MTHNPLEKLRSLAHDPGVTPAQISRAARGGDELVQEYATQILLRMMWPGAVLMQVDNRGFGYGNGNGDGNGNGTSAVYIPGHNSDGVVGAVTPTTGVYVLAVTTQQRRPRVLVGEVVRLDPQWLVLQDAMGVLDYRWRGEAPDLKPDGAGCLPYVGEVWLPTGRVRLAQADRAAWERRAAQLKTRR